jgi:ABC-type transport system involved in cytochrome c biogenesis permease subunit
MSRILRSFVAASLTSALLLASAAPALAETVSLSGNNEQSHTVPVLLDALFLRPVGMVVTALGTATFCVIAPIMAITRPTDMGGPFKALVMAPARYTWVDPLGYH